MEENIAKTALTEEDKAALTEVIEIEELEPRVVPDGGETVLPLSPIRPR